MANEFLYEDAGNRTVNIHVEALGDDEEHEAVATAIVSMRVHPLRPLVLVTEATASMTSTVTITRPAHSLRGSSPRA